MKNIFEKIINQELPSHKIYEDENFIAILDIYPEKQGHTLIIPKESGENILKNDEKILKEITKVAKELSLKIMETLNATSVKGLTNIGADAGQVVFHTHLHIIPFYKEEPTKLSFEQVAELLKK